MMMQDEIRFHRGSIMQVFATVCLYAGLINERLDPRDAVDWLDLARRALASPIGIAIGFQRKILTMLRPLESATRRLVIMMALGVLAPDKAHPRFPLPEWKARKTAAPADEAPAAAPAAPGEGASSIPAFVLLDPEKRFGPIVYPADAPAPVFWINDPDRVARDPLELRSNAPLVRRLAALAAALEDLPAQAQRFLRWMDRRARNATRRCAALRRWSAPGALPAHTPKRLVRREHDTLADVDSFARFLLRPLDTS